MTGHRIATLFVFLLIVGCSQSKEGFPIRPKAAPADLIVINAKVWTADESCPEATAFAVRDGRFVHVGDGASVRSWAGPDTGCLDAGGARIIPGIIDAHLHLIGGGLQLARLDLRNVADRPDFIAAVAERADGMPRGDWILGGRWSTESWPDVAQPIKEWIDAATRDKPVFLVRMDGHSALVNSAALKLAGIDRDGPPDPPGGKIDRDPRTKEPTGILKEAAMDFVRNRVPEDSAAEQDRALAAAVQHAHRHGITTVHTMSPWSRLAVMERARDARTLTLRVRCYVSEDDWTDYVDHVMAFRNDDCLRIAGFKQFMDGSLGSRTAYMAEPFADKPHLSDEPRTAGEPRTSVRAGARRRDWRGLLTAAAAKKGEIQRLSAVAEAAGLNPAFHAIGDQANHMLLDAYQAVADANGPRPDRRQRVEHAQHLLPGDIPRFADPGVVASMQPFHKADDGRYAERAIGPERCKTSYAFRSLLDAGAVLAFGSDWPVVTLNPLKGIRAAVTGKTLDGKTFVPEQNITAEEALRAYTVGGAYAAGDEDRLGRIKAGYLADFVILADDILSADPEQIGAIGIKATYVNGLMVWP